MSNKDKLTEVFKDTEKWYTENKTLAAAIRNSRNKTKVYKADDYPELPPISEGSITEITVTASRSFEAALRLSKEMPKKRIAVHNFASATKPGGGVTRGSNAQEECLCRCSTLYPVLNSKHPWDNFYNFHRKNNDLRYTDTCIYSPGILIVKTDTDEPQRLQESEWREVDIITCAAPNLREKPNNAINSGYNIAVKVTDRELLELHKKRAKHMLTIAASNKAEILVLGAFGCGVFQNKPEIVAKAYKETIGEFQGRFIKIEFAVYCTTRDTRNYEIFKHVLSNIK